MAGKNFGLVLLLSNLSHLKVGDEGLLDNPEGLDVASLFQVNFFALENQR